MNTLREAFERQADHAGTPDLDQDELIGRGEQQLRQRRLAAALGVVAAVIVAFAIGIGLNALNTGSPPPEPSHHLPQEKEQPPPRQIVYSDPRFGPTGNLLGVPIHLGDRVVQTGSSWIRMDVTDDGVVYTTGTFDRDGRVWFTDGGSPEQIGAHACAAPHGAANTVVTGSSGSWAAWFDCTRAPDPELVVYDTGSGREAVRAPLTECVIGHAYLRDLAGDGLGACNVDAIVGDHVYFTRSVTDRQAFQFDLATGRAREVEPAGAEANYPYTWDRAAQAYLDDLRSHRRGFVFGASWETGTPEPFGGFAVDGNRLVPGEDEQAFDTATHQPVRLHLPTDYHGAVEFDVFEWLDDDTVALIGPHSFGALLGEQLEPGYGDILTCRLPNGHCDLDAPGHGPLRLPANGTLPWTGG